MLRNTIPLPRLSSIFHLLSQSLFHADHAGRTRRASVWGHRAAHEDRHHHMASWVSEKTSENPLPFAPLHDYLIHPFSADKQLESKAYFIFLCSYDYQTLDYDIMLIKLFHPVEVTEAVAPIPLPTGCPMGGFPCSVSGWGNTALDGEGGLMGSWDLLTVTKI